MKLIHRQQKIINVTTLLICFRCNECMCNQCIWNHKILLRNIALTPSHSVFSLNPYWCVLTEDCSAYYEIRSVVTFIIFCCLWISFMFFYAQLLIRKQYLLTYFLAISHLFTKLVLYVSSFAAEHSYYSLPFKYIYHRFRWILLWRHVMFVHCK
jgi:hypothetical protein